MWKIQKKLKKIDKLESCGSLDVNDRLENFKETNEVNVEQNSSKFDELILERVKPTHHTHWGITSILPELLHDHVLPSLLSTNLPALRILICLRSEFEEVCLLIYMPRVLIDITRMEFILFTLKDDAKKWLHNHKVGAINSWNSFVDIFIKEVLPY